MGLFIRVRFCVKMYCRRLSYRLVKLLDGVYVDEKKAPVFVAAPPRVPPQPPFEFAA